MPIPIEPSTEVNVGQLLERGRTQLAGETARLDCQLLLANLLEKDRSWVIAHDDETVSEETSRQFLDQVTKRSEGTPIAYLLGKQAFWDMDLSVNQATLIPRPDTELLVETILEAHKSESAVVLDMGTGSGAIALALAKERPTDTVLAMDYNQNAATTAKQNAERHQINNVFFFVGEWSSAVAAMSIDIIVSNPPYIATDDPHLENLQFEPSSALVAGEDGLDDIKRILDDARRYLKPGGLIAIEHGFDQQSEVIRLFEQHGLVNVTGKCDLGQNPRLVVAEAPVITL